VLEPEAAKPEATSGARPGVTLIGTLAATMGIAGIAFIIAGFPIPGTIMAVFGAAAGIIAFLARNKAIATAKVPAPVAEPDKAVIDNGVFKVEDQAKPPILDAAKALNAARVDLSKLPAGTLVHYESPGGHWDYTLRIEENDRTSIWFRGETGRVTAPVMEVGTYRQPSGSKQAGILDEARTAFMPYFNQTPFGKGERALLSVGVGAYGFYIYPQDIMVQLPDGTRATDLPEGAVVEKTPEMTKGIANIVKNLRGVGGDMRAHPEAIVEAARAHYLNINGMLREGQRVALTIGGRPFTITGSEGESLKSAALRVVTEPALRAEIRGIADSDWGFESATTIRQDGSVEHETITNVEIQDGKLVNLSCNQKIYEGERAIYIHGHRGMGGFEEDRKNVAAGNFDGGTVVVLQGREGIAEVLQRAETAAAMPVRQSSWYMNYKHTLQPDGKYAEAVTRIEAEGVAPARQAGQIEEMLPPTAPFGIAARALFEGALGAKHRTKLQKGLEIVSAAFDEKGDASVGGMFGSLRNLREAGLTHGAAVLAFDARSVVDGNGAPTDASFAEILNAVRTSPDNIVRIVLIARTPEEQAGLISKVGSDITVVQLDGAGALSDRIRQAVSKDVTAGSVAIFLRDTGRELGMVLADAKGKSEDNMPAYAVLKDQPDGVNIGKINLKNLLASILFKGAFIGIGYAENDTTIQKLRSIFRFCKIFSDVAKAVEEIFTAIRETAVAM